MERGEAADRRKFQRVFAPRKPRRLRELVGLLSAYRSALNEFKPDAIFAFYPFANILAATAKLGRTVRVVAGQHNPSTTQNPLLYRLEMLIGSRLYDRNICVSRAVADTFRSHPSAYKRKIQVVHNGVPPLPSVSEEPEECRRRLGLPVGAAIVGTVGRLHPQKNHELLLQAMARAPGLTLALAGDGPLAPELRALAENLGIAQRVHFLGHISGADVSRFYRAIDTFAFPSRYEGFPRALIEALDAGLPTVAADIDVLREAGEDGALYVGYDPALWGETLMRLRSDEALRADLTQRARRRADSLSLDAMVDQYLAILAHSPSP